MNPPLVQVTNIKKHFPIQKGIIKALDGVSFYIDAGEVFALVGESGCGKSTLGRILLQLEPPSAGQVLFQGVDITKAPLTKQLAREKQSIFQDPYASLNPRMTIQEILEEPFEIHRIASPQEQIDELLSLVHLPLHCKSLFPHELSGGQRQRISIARALALEPKFIVCDEPVSALDVSVSAQILNLLKHLQKKRNLTLLFISHDLKVVKYISTRIGVMYLGHIVEIAPKQELYKNPLHPYTQALLSAIPIPDPILERARSKLPLQGELPSPQLQLKGCPFVSRCPYARPICHENKPKLKETSPGHLASCHLI